MIIKSSQRADHKELAIHLTKTVDNDGEEQEVQVTSYRNLIIGDNVHEALKDMRIMAWASPNVQKDLYHASMSPEGDLTDEEWETAWERYEDEYGLNEHAYIEVMHLKKGRAHRHRVYERVTTDGLAINLSWTKLRNEKVARMLEYEFGHSLTIGKHNRSVMNALAKEGREEIVAWMDRYGADRAKRPVAKDDYQDIQQERRTAVSKEAVQAAVADAWQRTENGAGFERAIAEHSLVLAKGDRRDFVIVDGAGGVHSPRRLLKVTVKELRERWGDLNPEHLPAVAQVQAERLAMQREGSTTASHQTTPNAVTEGTGVGAVPEHELLARKKQLDWEIALMKQQAITEALLEKQQQEARVADEMMATALETLKGSYTWESISGYDSAALAPEPIQDNRDEDKRDLVAAQIHWQKVAEPERPKPQAQPEGSQAEEPDVSAWGLHENTLRVMMTYDTEQARLERDRRLAIAEKEASSPAPAPGDKKTILSAYLRGLGQGVKERGKGYYRLADRFLAERLARLGYSRGQLRRVLASASPALMEQQPGQRASYIYRLTERVYQRQQQRQREQMLRSQQVDQSKKTPVQKVEKGKAPAQGVPSAQLQEPAVIRPKSKQVAPQKPALPRLEPSQRPPGPER